VSPGSFSIVFFMRPLLCGERTMPCVWNGRNGVTAYLRPPHKQEAKRFHAGTLRTLQKAVEATARDWRPAANWALVESLSKPINDPNRKLKEFL
jgi:hypothetical protein